MATIFRVKSTYRIPKTAEIVNKKGKRYVRIKRDGRFITCPVTECGQRYRGESKKWYIQYKDANGVWQRVPGYSDKDATLQKAADLERQVERRQAGLSDPHEDAKRRPLSEHVDEFEAYLRALGNSEKHATQTCKRIKKLLAGCGFSAWSDLTSSGVVAWLGRQRSTGEFGVKTSNYYQAAVKELCTWMVTDGRVDDSPLAHLTALNADADVRWQRRALEAEEFRRLVESAVTGPSVQCVSGIDRAMLYILATWTGYRRKELASITLASLNLDAEPATVSVKAAYSKRRRNDVVPLHAEVVARLKEWLKAKGPIPRTQPLFALFTAGGQLRRTSKMMRLDLERARNTWLEEATSEEERRLRESTDYLCYCNEDGLYADFHANRHTFISNLGRAGVPARVAQSLARHSDVNLTLGVYTHVGVDQSTNAIGNLAPPPEVEFTDLERSPAADQKSVAQAVAQKPGADSQTVATDGTMLKSDNSAQGTTQPLTEQGFVEVRHRVATDDQSSGGGTRTPDTRIMISLSPFFIAWQELALKRRRLHGRHFQFTQQCALAT